jgi:acyl-CoA synthetase (AMP-forming)/AMP-acid ligase II
VGCGRPLPGSQVIIVEPGSGVECAAGQVGEIWVSSPSVALGYWRRAEATNEAFNAQVSGRPAGHFLRTGDLGFLSGGQVVITGRLKDLIILNGRNIYPQDLEAAIEACHPMARNGGCVVLGGSGRGGRQSLCRSRSAAGSSGRRGGDSRSCLVSRRFEVPVWGLSWRSDDSTSSGRCSSRPVESLSGAVACVLSIQMSQLKRCDCFGVKR